MATEIILEHHECSELYRALQITYNEEKEARQRLEQDLEGTAKALQFATQSLIDKEREIERLRKVLEWYADEKQNYNWAGVPCHWEEKTYHKTPVKIPIPDMGKRAREALGKEG